MSDDVGQFSCPHCQALIDLDSEYCDQCAEPVADAAAAALGAQRVGARCVDAPKMEPAGASAVVPKEAKEWPLIITIICFIFAFMLLARLPSFILAVIVVILIYMLQKARRG